MRTLFLFICLFLTGFSFGQERPLFIKNQISLGTNILGYANFLTINAELGISIHRHWTIDITGKLNPWTFNKNTPDQLQNRHADLAIGVRWWPWHVNSGWFVGSSLQYSRYNSGGIIDKETFEGNAYGLNFHFGYALMLSKGWNIEFGAGILGGYTNYTKYSCPRCGRITGSDKKIFVAPNNLLVQIIKIF